MNARLAFEEWYRKGVGGVVDLRLNFDHTTYTNLVTETYWQCYQSGVKYAMCLSP